MINSPFAEFRDDGSTINATHTFDMPSEVTTRPHVFVGISFTTAAGVAANPTAGTITIQGETLANPGRFEDFINGNAAAVSGGVNTFDCAGNITRIRVTTATVSGNSVALFNIKVTTNVS